MMWLRNRSQLNRLGSVIKVMETDAPPLSLAPQVIERVVVISPDVIGNLLDWPWLGRTGQVVENLQLHLIRHIFFTMAHKSI